MSGLIAIDHRVAPVTLGSEDRADAKPATEWSARRRLSFLAACIVISWSLVITPLIFLLD